MAEECICHLGLWPKYSKKETIARVLLSLDIFCSVVYILAVLNDLTNLIITVVATATRYISTTVITLMFITMKFVAK